MTAALTLIQLSASPRLYQVDDFADAAEIAHILARIDDTAELTQRGIRITEDSTGISCELPAAGDAVLEDLRWRVMECTRIENDFGATFRCRRYRAGESHPPHRDVYRIADRHLVATALLYLCDTESGGETLFPNASPGPVRIQPRKGRLVFWFNHRPDLAEDPAAEHASLAVTGGEKVTLTSFLYQPLAKAQTTIHLRPRARPLRRSTGYRFHCVDDGVPEETTAVLRSACARKGVDYVAVEAREFDCSTAQPLGPRDLLYRPATSRLAMRVEQLLHAPEAASFHANAEAVLYDCLLPPLVFAQAGLPIPRTVYAATPDRDALRRYVEQLGGFPVVVKWLGHSSGVAVLRVDSFPALFSLMDYAGDGSIPPLLCAYIADAVHFRLVVIGARVVAAYRNAQLADDFRSMGSDDPADHLIAIDPEMAELAVAATRTLGIEMAGVDVLRARDGKLFLLEANFPCYFAEAQYAVGTDVAGMMIDHLLAKARATRGVENAF
jgi:hypothetical protein